MMRALLVVLSFIVGAYAYVSLFGIANGLIVDVIVTAIVAYGVEELWPPRRSHPVKIEPRLSRPAPPRFEILALPAPIARPEPFDDGSLIVENCQCNEVFSAPGVVPPDTIVTMHLRARANLDMESHYNLSSETLRDLARRVTPEMLALPIPTAVRALLDDLKGWEK